MMSSASNSAFSSTVVIIILLVIVEWCVYRWCYLVVGTAVWGLLITDECACVVGRYYVHVPVRDRGCAQQRHRHLPHRCSPAKAALVYKTR